MRRDGARRRRAARRAPAAELHRAPARLGARRDRAHQGAVHRDRGDRRAAPSPGAGPRLDHGGVLDAAGRHRSAGRARGDPRPALRPHAGDPAADRAQPARGRRSLRARRANAVGRLRRAAGRRRHALRRDHGRLHGARAGGGPAAAARRARARAAARLRGRRLGGNRRRRQRARSRLRGGRPRGGRHERGRHRAAGASSRCRGPAEGGTFAPEDLGALTALALRGHRRAHAAPGGRGRGGRARLERGRARARRRHLEPGQAARDPRAARRSPDPRLRARERAGCGASGGRRRLREQRRGQGARRGARSRPPRAGGRFGAGGRGARRALRVRARRASAGPGLDDAGRVRALLAALASARGAARAARFVCVAALATPQGDVVTARGECRGRMLEAPSGSGGFGYDPIFVADGTQVSFAELPEREKSHVSHRGIAIRALAPRLRSALAAQSSNAAMRS